MATPLVAVSGTFSLEYASLLPEMEGFGAIVSKTVKQQPSAGNPNPRIVEIPGGMLNAIGLQNPGIRAFVQQELPKYRNLPVPHIASIAGENPNEYAECAAMLADREEVAAIELNVSCPNVATGLSFGCEATTLRRLVAKVRKRVGDKISLIAKLTPNVTDIAVPAKAAVDGGASAISLINTLRGMSIDVHTRKPKLGNRIGGVSGTIIHPVAVYMVARCYESCCREHGIPILGMGGVYQWQDAVELILAGATCVGIGTALFRDLDVFQRVARGIEEYLGENKIKHVADLVGRAVAE